MQEYFVHLKERHVLRASGSDVFEFFQGLMTQDIYLLKDQPAIYTAFLSPQGKFLYDAFLVRDNEAILIDCFDAEGLLKHLRPYKLRRQVNLETTDLQVYVTSQLAKSFENTVSFSDPRKENFALRIIAHTLDDASAGEAPYPLHRIQQGIPEAPFDLIHSKTFPLEGRLDVLNAISFKKGCYVGQELVSRTHYTGVIRKKLLPVEFEGTSIQSNDEISQDDLVIGEVKSFVRVDEKTFAMCMIRIEEINPDEPVYVKLERGMLMQECQN